MLLDIGPGVAPILTSGPLAQILFNLLMNFHVFAQIFARFECLSTGGPTAHVLTISFVNITVFRQKVSYFGGIVTSGPFAVVNLVRMKLLVVNRKTRFVSERLTTTLFRALVRNGVRVVNCRNMCGEIALIFIASVAAFDSAEEGPVTRVDTLFVCPKCVFVECNELTSVDIAQDIAFVVDVDSPQMTLKSALTSETSRTRLDCALVWLTLVRLFRVVTKTFCAEERLLAANNRTNVSHT